MQDVSVSCNQQITLLVAGRPLLRYGQMLDYLNAHVSTSLTSEDVRSSKMAAAAYDCGSTTEQTKDQRSRRILSVLRELALLSAYNSYLHSSKPSSS